VFVESTPATEADVATASNTLSDNEFDAIGAAMAK
jgi:hypothetical protein